MSGVLVYTDAYKSKKRGVWAGWVAPAVGRRHREQLPKGTKIHIAEAIAIVRCLEMLPAGWCLDVRTDAQFVVVKLKKILRASSCSLLRPFDRWVHTIRAHQMDRPFTLTWEPRRHNLADAYVSQRDDAMRSRRRRPLTASLQAHDLEDAIRDR